MPSYYEIVVSFRGSHLFATAPRSLPATDEDKAKTLYWVLKAKFTENDGYKVQCKLWHITGMSVEDEFSK